MKYFLINIFVFVLTINAFAQQDVPVVWKKAFLHNKDNTIDLTFIAEIQDGWHLYSQTLNKDEGPIPTSFVFSESDNYDLMGKTIETQPTKKYDPNFEMEIAMFDRQAMFVQKIKPNSDSFEITGKISFMVCNDEQCIFPPEVKFEFIKEGKNLKYEQVEKQ